MNQDLLVEKVTEELLRRLKLLEGAAQSPLPDEKPWLVVGKPESFSWKGRRLEFIERFEETFPNLSDYAGLVLPELPVNQLVLASLGTQYGLESCLIVAALLEGAPVYAARKGLAWLDALKPGSPLRRHYEQCRERLESFGVVLFSDERGLPAPTDRKPAAPAAHCTTADLSDRKLLSEREVKELCPEGCSEVLVGRRTVITPLAVDVLRQRGIAVVRGEGGSA